MAARCQVSAKMGQLAELLGEMEEEGKKQEGLLRDMGRHTLEMVTESARVRRYMTCTNREEYAKVHNTSEINFELSSIQNELAEMMLNLAGASPKRGLATKNVVAP